jgi:hypothetical protein
MVDWLARAPPSEAGWLESIGTRLHFTNTSPSQYQREQESTSTFIGKHKKNTEKEQTVNEQQLISLSIDSIGIRVMSKRGAHAIGSTAADPGTTAAETTPSKRTDELQPAVTLSAKRGDSAM